jgi:hypothetical protein
LFIIREEFTTVLNIQFMKTRSLHCYRISGTFLTLAVFSLLSNAQRKCVNKSFIIPSVELAFALYSCTVNILFNVANELPQWSWVRLEKPTVSQLLKKFPEVYGKLRFITALTRASHCPLS